jgi:hypothetical protein
MTNLEIITDILLGALAIAFAADAWISYRWLRASRRVLEELQKQSADIAPLCNPGTE